MLDRYINAHYLHNKYFIHLCIFLGPTLESANGQRTTNRGANTSRMMSDATRHVFSELQHDREIVLAAIKVTKTKSLLEPLPFASSPLIHKAKRTTRKKEVLVDNRNQCVSAKQIER